MASAAHLTTVGTWSATNVDAETVQTHLTHFWREAAKKAGQQGQQAAARTSVLTLVVYADDQRVLDRATEAIAALVEFHPSRTILVLAQGDAEKPSLDADVSTRCLVSRQNVCHEQIVLRARGQVVEQVSSTVAALLVHDLPTFLWWPGNVTEQTEVLLRLLGMCNRLIVDSTRFTDPVSSFRVLTRLLGRARSLALTDMQWARLTGWRETTAQFFDAGGARDYLPAIDRVTVELGASDAAAPQPGAGLLYIGWLGSRLGWHATAAAAGDPLPRRFTVTAGSRPVAIELKPRQQGPAGPDQIAAVTLHATLDAKEASFVVEQQAEDQVTTHAEGEGLPAGHRTMRVPALTDVAMLQQELRIFGHDQAYEEALAWLRGLLPADGTKA